jgi:hypothetical protein
MGTALWYHAGLPAVPIRWVLARDPYGKLNPPAFRCTDVDAAAQQILEWFVPQWQVEATFEKARLHLGVGTQRQWNDRSIARTTPVLLGLYSLVTWLAKQMIVRSSEQCAHSFAIRDGENPPRITRAFT